MSTEPRTSTEVRTKSVRSRWLAVAGTTLVAGLAVVAGVVPALAAQEPVLTDEQQESLQSEIDAYRACIRQQGVTLPDKPADGSRPELSDEQRAALRAAHEACADQRPSRPELSDEQRAQLQAQAAEHRECMEAELSAAGITRPERPTPGERPADGQRPARPELTDEQKAAFQAAHAACEDLRPNLGVEGLPMFGHGHRGPGGPGGPGGPRGSQDSAERSSTTSAAV
jgi:hypothetical protein